MQFVYEYDLVNGKSATTYEPDSNLKLSEAIKLAACLHSIYYTGVADFPKNQTPWYQPHVDYALENGIITEEYLNYEAYATRAQFAVIFAAALPEEALTVMNDVELGAIPDVSYSYSYGPAVYLLYRAGITVGKDSAGTYYPNDAIKRSEVATITTRMASAVYRQTVTLTVRIPFKRGNCRALLPCRFLY